jgi:carbamoyltransferase
VWSPKEEGVEMRVLGIHDGHDASAALIDDGRVVAAMEEERMNRTKNWAGFPELAVKKICEMGSCSPAEIDVIAMHGNHMPYPKDRRELMAIYEQTGSLKTTIRRFARRTALRTLYNEMRRTDRLKWLKKAGLDKKRAVFVDHHLAHAACAYYGMPDKPDRVLVLTNDGAGDGLCATVNIGEKGELKRIADIPETDSLGNLYAMVTFIMGMVPLEHEYKLMGMAPYASDKITAQVYNFFKNLLVFPSHDSIVWKRGPGCPETYYSYDFLRDGLSLKRFDGVCGGLQLFSEKMLSTWVQNCIKHTNIHDVALGGGVFMNVKANKVISELPELNSMFIYPSCGDETNSIGSAFVAYRDRCTAEGRTPQIEPVGPFYYGPDYSDEEIEKALGDAKAAGGSFSFARHEDIEAKAASLLAEGIAIGRFKGRMEFGARALGNRSILADPTVPGVVKVINDMIKNRDFWMPFAPSMLEERADDYIVNPKGVEAPYMIMSFDSTDKVGEMAAAVHPYDETARPQVVKKDWNPDYHRLLKEFEKLTGRGVVLNTSFNLHGYPIVCSPEDAVDVFQRSGMTHLVIGSYLAVKE